MNKDRKLKSIWCSTVKMFPIIVCIALLLTGLDSYGQVSGMVYQDLNRNGEKETSEEGISGVGVTNGIQVVLTDKNGRYQLPVSDNSIISVIKPTGYALPVDEDNLPQFYYIHKPEGSVDTRYPGVDPTGKLPASVDFGIYPIEEAEEFSILVFGDPQPYNRRQVGYFEEAVVNEVAGSDAFSFGLSLGDLVGNNLDLFEPYIQALKKAGIPWFNVIGNHDLNFDVEIDQHTDETFEAYFGPATYSFNAGKTHFIVMDDILFPDPRDGKSYHGGLRDDQLEFIKNDLKLVPKDYLIVLAMHIPLSEINASDVFNDQDRNELFRLLKDFPNTLSLSAHTHLQRQDFLTEEDGWLREKPHHHFNVGTTSGDWYSGELDENGIPIAQMRDGTPKGYAIIHFNGNQYTIDYKVAGKPQDYRMEIFAPKVVAKGNSTKARIYVNFFMGGERDTVTYRIDNGQWMPMHKDETHDPSFEKSIYRWDLAEELLPGRRPSNPSDSRHLWSGRIPANLEIGRHEIEVRVQDMFGRTFTQTGSYRIEEPIR